jgi:hypothetical protein
VRADKGGETAVRPGDHAFAADEVDVPAEALSDQLGVFDVVGLGVDRAACAARQGGLQSKAELRHGDLDVGAQDVMHHYQQFLQHRRDLRPIEEYRATTAQEWSEFEEHFDKRKVELGGCARPYGTPCAP